MGIAKDCLLDSKLHDVDEICILYYFHKYIIGLYQIKYWYSYSVVTSIFTKYFECVLSLSYIK